MGGVRIIRIWIFIVVALQSNDRPDVLDNGWFIADTTCIIHHSRLPFTFLIRSLCCVKLLIFYFLCGRLHFPRDTDVLLDLLFCPYDGLCGIHLWECITNCTANYRRYFFVSFCGFYVPTSTSSEPVHIFRPPVLVLCSSEVGVFCMRLATSHRWFLVCHGF